MQKWQSYGRGDPKRQGVLAVAALDWGLVLPGLQRRRCVPRAASERHRHRRTQDLLHVCDRLGRWRLHPSAGQGDAGSRVGPPVRELPLDGCLRADDAVRYKQQSDRSSSAEGCRDVTRSGDSSSAASSTATSIPTANTCPASPVGPPRPSRASTLSFVRSGIPASSASRSSPVTAANP